MKKIMIVDDEPMMLKIAQRPLKDKYETVLLSSGQEALDAFETEAPDLILSDVKMPEMSGPQLLSMIREKKKDMPFIFMSADDDGCEDELLGLGNTWYIKKPIKPDDLLEVVGRSFENGSGDLGAGTDEPNGDSGKIALVCGGAGSDKEKVDLEKEEELLPSWLLSEPMVDIKQGLENSGGAEVYMSSLKIFLDHVEENVSFFNQCIEKGDFENYTIKAHALKSTSRIIGAMVLSSLSAAMERAGKKNNDSFIISEHEEFIRLYRRYEKLFLQHTKAVSKAKISERNLSDMLLALKEYAMAQDYTLTEMVINSFDKYELESDVETKISNVKKHLLKLDWDEIMVILN